MRYKTHILILAVTISLAVSRATAFHADIFLVQQSGSLLTGRGAADPGSGGMPQVGVRFHVNDIAGLSPFVDVNPGVSAEEAGDSFFTGGLYQPLPGNRNVGFNVQAFRVENGPAGNLFFWNGSGEVDFRPVANINDQLNVRSGASGSVIVAGEPVDVTGFDFTVTDSSGFIHDHLIFDFDVDNNTATPASTGIFLTAFGFQTDLDEDDIREVARPHYVAWFNGPPGAFKTNAMAAANAFLTENFADLRLFGDVSPLGDDDLPDDRVDAQDIDTLLAAVASTSGDPLFDLNHDSVVDVSDVGTLFDILGTGYGDANLDGFVNGADLDLWQEHYGTTGGWGSGDFSGDGYVGGRDFLVWQRHFGLDADSAATYLVPESVPVGLLVTLAIFGLTGHGDHRAYRTEN